MDRLPPLHWPQDIQRPNALNPSGSTELTPTLPPQVYAADWQTYQLSQLRRPLPAEVTLLRLRFHCKTNRLVASDATSETI